MINQTFKTLRESKKISANKLAETLGISIHTYRKYEESTRYPSRKIINKMCEEFQCDYNTIMSVINNHKYIFEQKQNNTKIKRK